MDGNYITGGGRLQQSTDKPREQSLFEIVTGLDDIQKSIDDLGGRVRVAADRIDGGKPRDASGGTQVAAPNGGPIAYDLKRRANLMRDGLSFLHGEMLRLEVAIGTGQEPGGR